MRAKQLIIDRWINCDNSYTLDVFSPKVKIIHAFQMLCPGCVYIGIPQTVKLFEKFHGNKGITIVGVHTVFENHHAMTPEALTVFVNEWKIPFPVGIDKHIGDNWMPETMKSYSLQGTPSMIIIDHLGEVRLLHFGHLDYEKLEQLIIRLAERNRAT